MPRKRKATEKVQRAAAGKWQNTHPAVIQVRVIKSTQKIMKEHRLCGYITDTQTAGARLNTGVSLNECTLKIEPAGTARFCNIGNGKTVRVFRQLNGMLISILYYGHTGNRGQESWESNSLSEK